MGVDVAEKLIARWALGHDGADHVLYENAEVIFEAGFVVRVGPHSDAAADVTHDLGMALIAPGFVDLNALADVDTTIMGVAVLPAASGTASPPDRGSAALPARPCPRRRCPQPTRHKAAPDHRAQ